MGLFDKKFCDICGAKIGLLAVKKVDDGIICPECNKKLSPFFTGRKKTTLEDIKAHLAYREANKAKLSSFVVSDIFLEGRKLYIDRTNGNFAFSYSAPDRWAEENPDIIPMSEISFCGVDVKEHKTEVFRRDASGNNVSYEPKRYKYTYDFWLELSLTSAWFNKIEVKINSNEIEGLNSTRYHNCELTGERIRAALSGAATAGSYTPGDLGAVIKEASVKAEIERINEKLNAAGPAHVSAPAPAPTGWVCQQCGAENTGKFCENCGTPKPAAAKFCPNCGAKYAPGSVPKFCPECGSPL